MLRACRFAAQLGFTYEQAGCEALPACGAPNTPYYLPHGYSFPVERCAGLSLERVRKELEKLITAKYAGKGLMLMMQQAFWVQAAIPVKTAAILLFPFCRKHCIFRSAPNPRFHLYDTWEHTLLAIDNSPRDLAIRWALVLHDLGKGLPNVRKLNKEGQPSDPGHEADEKGVEHCLGISFERKAQIFADAGEGGFQGGPLLCGHPLGKLYAQRGLSACPSATADEEAGRRRRWALFRFPGR